MPALPSGGLLIFINLIILIVGLLVRGMHSIGVKTSLVTKVFSPFVDKRFDGVIRKAFAYLVIVFIGVIVTILTVLSVDRGVKNNSNYTTFATLYKEGHFHETLSYVRGALVGVSADDGSVEISTEKMTDAENKFIQPTKALDGLIRDDDSAPTLSPAIKNLATHQIYENN